MNLSERDGTMGPDASTGGLRRAGGTDPRRGRLLVAAIVACFVLAVLVWVLVYRSPTPPLGPPAPRPTNGPNTWTNMTGAVHPPANATIAYDALRGQIVLFAASGSSGETWTYNPDSAIWRNVTPPDSPPLLWSPRLIYDSSAGRVLLFGVNESITAGEVWAYDPGANRWALRWTGGGIALQGGGFFGHGFAVVYVPTADRVLMFGGGWWAPHWSGVGSNESWVYDYGGNAWSRVNTTGNPFARYGSGMAYDAAAERVLLFGGCGPPVSDTCGSANDTWSYDFANETWTELPPLASPPPSTPYGAMAYDVSADRVVLFHGNETWTFDSGANRWTEKDPRPSPPPRYAPAMAYAAARGQTVLFGGRYTTGLYEPWTFYADTWVYVYGPG